MREKGQPPLNGLQFKIWILNYSINPFFLFEKKINIPFTRKDFEVFSRRRIIRSRLKKKKKKFRRWQLYLIDEKPLQTPFTGRIERSRNSINIHGINDFSYASRLSRGKILANTGLTSRDMRRWEGSREAMRITPVAVSLRTPAAWRGGMHGKN